MSLRGGVTRLSSAHKAAPLTAALLFFAVGCGEGGVAENAVLNVYAVSPLCAEAKGELAKESDVRLRVVCLPNAERDGRLDLAAIGANARRATEDSSAIAYIGEPSAAGTRFSAPILDAAGIRQFSEMSGAAGVRNLLRTIEEDGYSRF